jgi:hypothetical protein
MATDPELLRHKEWLGFLQPVGLVVSPPALVKAQAVVSRNVVELQQTLRETVETSDDLYCISDFAAFAVNALGWQPTDLVPASELPTELSVLLREYGEILAPSFAVPDSESGGWLMLVQVIPTGTCLDEAGTEAEKSGKWGASPQAKFERLLRETGIPVGVLCNGADLRLVYAPRGESSGYLTFPVQAMCEVSGRLILGAMEMLLGADRLFNYPSERRLAALLQESRKYQNEVSTKLSEQVLDALWELLRGFQIADEGEGRTVLSLQKLAKTDPQHIYGGLVAVLLRLVFLLYAEDEGLMPQDAIYSRNYSVTGLFEKLREDAGNYPDTMDRRYGAWAWLLSLFRLVYDGGAHGNLYLPARHGQLFDPDEYPFLEGRSLAGSAAASSAINVPRISDGFAGCVAKSPAEAATHSREMATHPTINVPRISDGVIFRVLHRLLVLDGERLSYRALDVEQIGSVYEAVMGYEVERAAAPCIGVWSKPKSAKSSVTVVVNLQEVLAAKPSERAKLLKDSAGCEVSGNALAQLKDAKTVEDIVAAIGRKVSPSTPNILPAGSLYLQPGEERRRSGSHYTPRSLTEPIVRTTLEPVLRELGENPTPEQILSLKVCDPAMGSGAFLVETCRQLAEKLVRAWERHGNTPLEKGNLENIPPVFKGGLEGERQNIPDGAELLTHARRLVAQRCLYGVDKNPFAVNLAKLSLWLVTLAKDYPFTFLDHALKCGDSLVGVTREEIQKFIKESDIYNTPLLSLLKQQVSRAKAYRDEIGKLGDGEDEEKRQRFQKAESELQEARLTGNVAVAAFFGEDTDKKRKEKRLEFSQKVNEWRTAGGVAAVGCVAASGHQQMPAVGCVAASGHQQMPGKNTSNAPYELAKTLQELEAVGCVAASGHQQMPGKNTSNAPYELAKTLQELEAVGCVAASGHQQMPGKNTSNAPYELVQILQELEKPVTPFHWEVEFPEVFDKENPGFDAVVGNPPFFGGSKISSNFGNEYLEWLKVANPESHGNADLVAHFFRRAFAILRKSGCFGLIATNTIAQGDTRSTGLRYICQNGGAIYCAQKRFKWPGIAAVVVSVVHVQKVGCVAKTSGSTDEKSLMATHPTVPAILDGREVTQISAFLFHAGGSENPAVLLANANKSFTGAKIYGQGFTFDDSDADATPIAEMRRLIEKNPKNAERIFPYIGGEEVNSSPTHAHHRYVINFGEMSEAEAWEYPDWMKIVEEKVKPQRLAQKREIRARYWWRFGETTPALFQAIAQLDRVLVCSLHSQYLSLAFLSTNTVFSHAMAVFAIERFAGFSIMQSRVHEIWARFFGSSLEDRLRYTPTDCFETFPFPENWETNPTLEEIGKTYYEYRAGLMVRNSQGLTDTYNRFHDPDERNPEILKLRELHAEMDRAVLDAYGWKDIPTGCTFLLDYEEEEEEDSPGKKGGFREKKKPWRCRWPEDVRDEVLARLLELNLQRSKQEILGGKAAEGKPKGKGGKKAPAKSRKKGSDQPTLFNLE